MHHYGLHVVKAWVFLCSSTPWYFLYSSLPEESVKSFQIFSYAEYIHRDFSGSLQSVLIRAQLLDDISCNMPWSHQKHVALMVNMPQRICVIIKYMSNPIITSHYWVWPQHSLRIGLCKSSSMKGLSGILAAGGNWTLGWWLVNHVPQDLPFSALPKYCLLEE